ncbi:hypothetical protein C5167_015190 [Papaver somniferum]|uniref:Uncharacterized protein n=1 Tax=Papaver somniferum TaxID=3469 RepID=A0A4Y7J687_PAPSO|nr:hypothetical protein C5167_015190 [Papaver somniferum]
MILSQLISSYWNLNLHINVIVLPVKCIGDNSTLLAWSCMSKFHGTMPV